MSAPPAPSTAALKLNIIGGRKPKIPLPKESGFDPRNVKAVFSPGGGAAGGAGRGNATLTPINKELAEIEKWEQGQRAEGKMPFANTPAGQANAAARQHAAATFRARTAAEATARAAAAAATKARLKAAEEAAVHAATLAKRAVEEAKRAAEEVAKAAGENAKFRAQFQHGMTKKNATKAGKTVHNRVLQQTLKAKGLSRRGTRKNNRR